MPVCGVFASSRRSNQSDVELLKFSPPVPIAHPKLNTKLKYPLVGFEQ
jgi:hypothetical protein